MDDKWENQCGHKPGFEWETSETSSKEEGSNGRPMDTSARQGRGTGGRQKASKVKDRRETIGRPVEYKQANAQDKRNLRREKSGSLSG